MTLAKARAKANKTFIDHHLPSSKYFIVQATGACTLKIFTVVNVAVK